MNPCASRDPLRPAEAPVAIPPQFKYSGPGRIFIVGRVTRRLYEFSGTGAVVSVAREDAAFLARIPSLTLVAPVRFV